jgi:hypothetical protein
VPGCRYRRHAEPPIAIYVQEPGSLAPDRLETPGRWRAEPAWPVPGATERTLWFGSGGRLTDEATGSEDVERLAIDPTVGTTGGLWSGGVPFGLPGDQRRDEARSSVFTSEPLAAPITILGRARATLFVGSTTRVAGVAVSVADVDPVGASHLVAKGMLDATRRRSLSDPEPLVPGDVIELAIDVDTTAWRFAEGHRIRVSIAGADWPNVWPTPETGALTVHTGGQRPSRIALPVVPDEGAATPPTFAPSPLAARSPAAARPAPTWTVEEDLLTGRMSATVETDAVFRPVEGVLIERDFGCVCEVDPADPAHATARGHHRCRSTRDGSWTESRADVVIASDADYFHVTIDLAVRTDGEVRATRHWDETIPRVLL